ncbi:MAG: carbon starvation protein A [Clostridiaceae bacterium]
MNSLVLILLVIVIFVGAYVTYGSFLCKKWGVDASRPTPAHTREDGVDYCPAKAPVLLGHHFSSIAGAGPIVGPIQAVVFGWLPVMLWIIIGSIFVGGVHDMGSLFASVRHDGKSIGEVIHVNMGDSGKKLFSWFAWLTLLLVIAAFTSICAGLFAGNPSVGTSSVLFILLAIGFGFLVYRRGAGLLISSIIGVALLFACIWIGVQFPFLSFSKEVWIIILLVYIAIASIVPVWILLQPRDYLNSFLLYIMMAGAVIGIIVLHPTIQTAAVTSFQATGNYNYLFPMLFVTVACGAISGFHSLVGSGTTSKQIDSEKDIKLIGYGSMLIEGVLATVAIITATYITSTQFGELAGAGGVLNVFSTGVGAFMNSFGIPAATGTTFAALAISAFALTSLDTATRLGRFIFQEMFDNRKSGNEKANILTNKYVATGITVVLGGLLTFKGYEKIWPIFGSANQLLAALALLSLAVYLKKQGKDNWMAVIPTIFMFIVTLAALVLVALQNLKPAEGATGSPLLVVVAAVLFVLAIVLIVIGFKTLSSKENTPTKNMKA